MLYKEGCEASVKWPALENLFLYTKISRIKMRRWYEWY